LRRTLPLLLALALAVPATAQDAGRRQSLTALAGVLGESQALRELCEGRKDQYWRSRMMRLLSVEHVEGEAGGPLTAAFNSGYADAKAAYAACGPESRRAEVEAAERGQTLAAALAVPLPSAEPEAERPADGPMAEPPEPR
jgi:uncharacterized protein (TIGR02301 family)